MANTTKKCRICLRSFFVHIFISHHAEKTTPIRKKTSFFLRHWSERSVLLAQ